MGIVTKQTSQNIIFTYIGFAIGGCSTVFLYPLFLAESHYGLISFLLSAANIMMPIMTFGVQNTVIKYYYTYEKEKQGGFVLNMLMLPLLLVIPLGIVGIFCYEYIADFLSKESPEIRPYVWLIYILGISYSYFEICFAIEKIQLRSTFGNFMREIFHRLFIPILLVMVYYKAITPETFIYAVVSLFVLRMALMMWYVFRLKPIVLKWVRLPNRASVLKYAILMVFMGLVANILIDIGKIALGNQLDLNSVAHYSVAVFVVTVIAIPSRAMHQIVAPITAKLLAEKDINTLGQLYKKASSNLYILSGFVFVVIMSNINQFYKLLPEGYQIGFFVMFILAFSRLLESIAGNNNAIFFNSDRYRSILWVLLLTGILATGLVFWLVSLLGITGAIVATSSVLLLYHGTKVYMVYRHLRIHPFSKNTLKITLVLMFFFVTCSFWDFPVPPIIAILIKTILVAVGFVFAVLKFSLSQELKAFWDLTKARVVSIFRKI